MSQYSYIRQQIENYRATLKQIEERAGVSPEDEGLIELKRIFMHRISSLETMLEEDRATVCGSDPQDLSNAA